MKSSVAALLTGVLVSLALFWLMQVMLMGHRQTVKPAEQLSTMDFIRLKREPPKPKIEKPPEKKVEQVQNQPKPERPQQKTPPKKPEPVKKPSVTPKAETPPVITPIPAPVTTEIPNAPVVSAPQPSAAPAQIEKSDKDTNASNGINSGVVPLQRVPPKYPPRAANRHIEGWVKIEFTISTDGDVENAVVVEAEPDGIFDEAALQAIKKWKFREKIVDGVAVTQRAVQTLQFKLTR